MDTPFWIAHHSEEQRCRCVRLFGLDVCARCLGLYPLLFLLLGIEMAMKAPSIQPFEPWLIVASTLPALFDWARGRFEPCSGNNAFRVFTGLLLACALSRTIWFHMIRPFHIAFCAHFLWLLLAAALIEIMARRHRHQASSSQRLDLEQIEALSMEALLADSELPDALKTPIQEGGAQVSSSPESEACQKSVDVLDRADERT